MMTAVAVAGIISSCRSDVDGDELLSDSPFIDNIGLSIVGRQQALLTRADDLPDSGSESDGSDVTADDYEIVGDMGDGTIDYTKWDIDQLTPYSLDFDESCVVQVSQKTRTVNPFESDDLTYSFSYEEGTEDATWNDENSYNFKAFDEDEPLEWNKIGQAGSWNGGFGLFCLYFPVENYLRQRPGDNGLIYYNVMEDQSTIDNLKKSDILGAYHTSSKLFSRIRFRLFHLMTYIRIRLYVPVYDDELHTGYRENALEYATLNNVTPDFIINWDAIRSSDTEGPALKALDGEGEIKMYQHPATEDGHKIMKIRYRDFIPSIYFDQGLGDEIYDKVRVYDFSVIIPLQTGMLNDDGTQGTFAESKFLNFYFRTNSGAITKYYFNQNLTANTTQSSLELNQGNYQYLQLYLPRVGNQPVCVSATVNPWGKMGTDMLLTPDEEE